MVSLKQSTMYSRSRCIIMGVIIGILVWVFVKWNHAIDLDMLEQQVKKQLSDSDLTRNEGTGKVERFTPKIDTALGYKAYEELEKEVFKPFGYVLRNASVIPALDFMEPLNCPKVFSDWLEKSESHNESGTPPKEIPDDLLNAFTMNGYASLVKDYRDDRSGTKNAVWTKDVIDSFVKREPNDVAQAYSGDGVAVYNAMKAFNVSGKRGAVIGSLSPWVEAFALKFGAEHVTTMEYMHISVPDDDRIDAKHPVEVAKNTINHIGKYDFIASFSSIEHSGLGRYGDALDPIGDLREAMKLHCFLKENGLLFIGFPFGFDTLHWNLHRIYGRIRFALFAAGMDLCLPKHYRSGFDILERYDRNGLQSINEKLFKRGSSPGSFKQFIMVLRKRS